MSVFELKDVSFWYDAENPEQSTALRNISFSIEKGEFVAILGPNGSGKSTLAKCLNAILLPSRGTVLVNGIDTSDESLLYQIRKTAGMVFQNPDNQIVSSIVEDDVAFAPENMGLDPKEIRRRVDRALEQVNMTEFASHAPHLLSGGQKQRIAIAGVLAMEPEAMIMDEPTAMLDPSGRKEVLDEILRLNKEKQMTIALITHHMDEAALADRIIVIKDGEIFAQGTPKQIFSQPEKIREASLTIPQTVELALALGIEGTPLTTEECTDAIIKWLEEK